MSVCGVSDFSFSDGGELGSGPQAVVKRARQLVQDGASMLDIGGESTRPGAAQVELDEELQRVIPAIQ